MRSAGEGGSKPTPREMDVLQAMCSGLGIRAIAARLGITPRAVKAHRLSLYRKLQCHPADREPHCLVAKALEIVDRARREREAKEKRA